VRLLQEKKEGEKMKCNAVLYIDRKSFRCMQTKGHSLSHAIRLEWDLEAEDLK
jgi:hypothetical protein